MTPGGRTPEDRTPGGSAPGAGPAGARTPPRFQAVLFDLDGTLVDSAEDLRCAVNALLAEDGQAGLDPSELRAMIGDGASMLVRRALAARGLGDPAGTALPRFLAHYENRCTATTRAYPGMPELIARLAAEGRRLAVVTNKPTGFSRRILEHLGLAAHFAEIVGPERVSEKKPSPAHVLETLALLGMEVAPEHATDHASEPASHADARSALPRPRVAMVGDGPTDMLAGRAAGVATIGVAWGFRPESELVASGADRIVRSVEDLSAALG